MAIPAYPAFESPFAASSTYWTGVSATGPMDMASLRAAIRAIIRIGPSATAARSDMLNMYPNNTQAISMNDRWVRAMIGPYVAATTTQTYGQGTSINFNAINSNASGLYTGQNIINVVNLFIKER